MFKQSLLLSFLLLPFTSSNASNFPDVPDDHYYLEAIEWAADEGIVQGYGDGTFGPSNTLTRAEFVKVVLEAKYDMEEEYGLNKEEACFVNPPFPDVQHGDWFFSYTCLAKQKDIIGGYADGRFGPYDTITFAEASKILVKTFGIKSDSKKEERLRDDYKTSYFLAREHWSISYVLVLLSQDIIPWSAPNVESSVNRGEMVEMVYRIMMEQKSDASSSYVIDADPGMFFHFSGDHMRQLDDYCVVTRERTRYCFPESDTQIFIVDQHVPFGFYLIPDTFKTIYSYWTNNDNPEEGMSLYIYDYTSKEKMTLINFYGSTGLSWWSMLGWSPGEKYFAFVAQNTAALGEEYPTGHKLFVLRFDNGEMTEKLKLNIRLPEDFDEMGYNNWIDEKSLWYINDEGKKVVVTIEGTIKGNVLVENVIE